MSIDQRRMIAKTTLVIYFLISATFELAHKDWVPLDGRRVISAVNPLIHFLDTHGGVFVCPAHLFSQSTTATDTKPQNFASPKHFSFLQMDEHLQYPARPQTTTSTRGPPEA